MTEREKMLSGELYDPTDKELEQLRLNARKLARKYNLPAEDCAFRQSQALPPKFGGVSIRERKARRAARIPS